MYRVSMLEVDHDNWWTIEILGPGGGKIKYREQAADKAAIESRLENILCRLNRDFGGMQKRVKGGWRQSRDEGMNQTFSEEGERRRSQRREAYRAKLKAHFAERKAAREKKAREAENG